MEKISCDTAKVKRNRRREMRDNALQTMCRDYLDKLKFRARKFGLYKLVTDLIDANTRHECKASEQDVDMLARMCNDDRIGMNDIPPLLGKSYRRCFEDEDFARIKRSNTRKSYNKVSAILLATDLAFERVKQQGKKLIDG